MIMEEMLKPMGFTSLAKKAIKEDRLTAEECRAVLCAPDEDVLALLSAAYSVRKTFCGNKVHIHVLMNAKSGLCPEDCNYCSQSKLSTADISKYAMVSQDRLLEAAGTAKEAKAKRFCIVTSGRGATWGEIKYLSEAVRSIRDEVGIKVCCCVGLLDEPKAKALKDAGVDRLNHNLNLSLSGRLCVPRLGNTDTITDLYRFEKITPLSAPIPFLLSVSLESRRCTPATTHKERQLRPYSVNRLIGTEVDGKQPVSP